MVNAATTDGPGGKSPWYDSTMPSMLTTDPTDQAIAIRIRV